ncbi:Stilbene synthase 3 [Triticum urartu]|uniref:Stilbene synthase 3 n=1 Tax=Triticum urartu TaxID=4572 RepID=M7ZGY8_TRIUA|nr:Stilbene synthase 3 [Triticum urartu]
MVLLGNLTASPAAAVIRQAQRADGPASVLAIGTANPANCVLQQEYADYYFRVTNAEHDTKLKSKLHRIYVNRGSVECPLFEMVAASQAVIPESERAAAGRLGEDGLLFRPAVEMTTLIRENVEQCLVEALAPLGLSGGWNRLFWAVHPGGRAILDGVEAVLRLDSEKLAASRHVLSEYGNMSGPTVIFVLDEIRRRRGELGVGRDGLGVLLGLGPGISVETIVLHATGNY